MQPKQAKAGQNMKEEKIIVRPVTPADVGFMVQLINDPDVTRYLPVMITDPEMMKSWILSLRTSDHEFIVELEGTSIGECSLTCINEYAEIGFMLLPKYWRHGYGSQVVQRLLEKAGKLGIATITAITDTDNEAAIKLLKKAGFLMERTGWMLKIPEEHMEETVPAGQHIAEFSIMI